MSSTRHFMQLSPLWKSALNAEVWQRITRLIFVRPRNPTLPDNRQIFITWWWKKEKNLVNEWSILTSWNCSGTSHKNWWFVFSSAKNCFSSAIKYAYDVVAYGRPDSMMPLRWIDIYMRIVHWYLKQISGLHKIFVNDPIKSKMFFYQDLLSALYYSILEPGSWWSWDQCW